ncbi:hypothetical protein H6G97_49120 [Nostoc flagelliforme FACHB-838]|uniref:Uncharacterized protein n=1 Tax=Nostoc flagelliforme FACHB-838 TaxID=2692904 RepID=A0ABR8E5N6_9NOSO|nr:hypothetical protein [Nostoc flagelliforme]MBD2536783.1 hypothetical protein [Nostoc flagelliforme FACHB-838]
MLVCENGEPFACGLRPGIQIQLNNQLSATVGERDPHIPRLWKLRFSQSGSELIQSLYRIGQPIRYEYVSAPWALDAYENAVKMKYLWHEFGDLNLII